MRVLDLPGAYSLNATSADEAVTRDVVHGARAGERRPDLLVCVADATNLRLDLRMVLEVKRLGRPMLVALNMADVAREARHRDRRRRAVARARHAGRRDGRGPPRRRASGCSNRSRRAAVSTRRHRPRPWTKPSIDDVLAAQAEVRRLLSIAVREPPADALAGARVDETIDRVVLHPVWGMAILAVVLFLMFQAVFSWAQCPMDAIKAAMESLGERRRAMRCRTASLRSLLVDGVIAGAGSVLVFLPQILILFFFILALEDSGYLPRAAFLLDRVMGTVGLSGPLLHPAAVELRLRDPRHHGHAHDRRTGATGSSTIMIAPLMTCSARLPVYALLIGAFVPARSVWRRLQPAGPGAVRAVRRRHRRRDGRGLGLQALGGRTTARSR